MSTRIQAMLGIQQILDPQVEVVIHARDLRPCLAVPGATTPLRWGMTVGGGRTWGTGDGAPSRGSVTGRVMPERRTSPIFPAANNQLLDPCRLKRHRGAASGRRPAAVNRR